MVRSHLTWALAAIMVAGALATSQAQRGARPDTSELLAKVAAYVARFTEVFTSVVAEERYVQQASGRVAVSGSGRLADTSVVGADRRELVSDFLLIRLPEVGRWAPFRDVFQVNGRPVRRREERLLALLTRPTDSGISMAQAITEESARYNIGEVERTINMPLLALGFLDARQQGRFRFKVEKEDPGVRPGAWALSYREQEKPTVVTTPDGRNLFASGTVWVMPSGEIVRTELGFLKEGLHALVTATFTRDERFGVLVPREMDEVYTLRKSEVRGHATYSRFRKFVVTSSEVMPLPEAN
jgi:hypothetical protein